MFALRERTSPQSLTGRFETPAAARLETTPSRHGQLMYDFCGALVILLALVAYAILA